MSLVNRAKTKAIWSIYKLSNPDHYLDKIIHVNQLERDVVIDNIYSVNNNYYFFIVKLIRKNYQ